MYTSHLDLYLHLIDQRNVVDGPWMLIGDFNDIIHPSEQKGGNFYHYREDNLLNVTDKCNLVEVKITGKEFTWNRPCTSNLIVYLKLDRALVNVAWRMAFPGAYFQVLCKFHSNHNLILLRCGLM